MEDFQQQITIAQAVLNGLFTLTGFVLLLVGIYISALFGKELTVKKRRELKRAVYFASFSAAALVIVAIPTLSIFFRFPTFGYATALLITLLCAVLIVFLLLGHAVWLALKE